MCCGRWRNGLLRDETLLAFDRKNREDEIQGFFHFGKLRVRMTAFYFIL
jgi:hypothetical protein